VPEPIYEELRSLLDRLGPMPPTSLLQHLGERQGETRRAIWHLIDTGEMEIDWESNARLVSRA
jgi:hypothetical protein